MITRRFFRVRKYIVGLMIYHLVFYPGLVVAGSSRVLRIGQTVSTDRSLPDVGARELPVVMNGQDAVNGADFITSDDGDTGRLTVLQNQEKADIKWDTFNIGEKAGVHFDQQGNANWYVLNRIYDQNPSQIYGQLTADGKVYLINQNGLLFGQGSRVANLHTLVASTLNIADQDFYAGVHEYAAENYQSDTAYDASAGFIDLQGDIETQTGGAALFFAPTVENHGTISAPGGQVALVAGEKAVLGEDKVNYRTELAVRVEDNPGTATNTGAIHADQGVAGMYGGIVNQEGLIRSVTAVYKNGTVELLASERITTGKESYTGTPLSDSSDTADGSFETGNVSKVTLSGLVVGEDFNGNNVVDYPDAIVHQGAIAAKSGEVIMAADNRIYLEGADDTAAASDDGDAYSGSVVDVSGAWAENSASENQISVQLNSVELSDEFLARLGDIKGATIKVNALEGSDIGHVGGHLNLREKNVTERSTAGGTIELTVNEAGGDVIVKDGAEIDFSGGGVHYSAGYVATSKVKIGATLYDIADIPDEVLENADELTLVEETGSTLIPAYDQGDDAGELIILANTVVLDGRLDGSATTGLYQTMALEPTETIGDITYQTAIGRRMPMGGRLRIGDNPLSTFTLDRYTQDIVVRGGGNVLDADFDSDGILADQTTILSADMLNEAGLGGLSLFANYTITTDADAVIRLAGGITGAEADYRQTESNFREMEGMVMVARAIYHNGEIILPGGDVILNNDYNYTSELPGVEMERGIWLGEGSLIDVSGEECGRWRDTAAEPVAVHMDGGTITLNAQDYDDGDQDHSQGVFLAESALLDVSGGHLVAFDGTLSGGDAGTLTIFGDTVALDGTVAGHSLVGSTGGTIDISSSNIKILPDGSEDLPASGFGMAADRLADSGFTHVQMTAKKSITFSSDAKFSPSTTKYDLTFSDRGVAKTFMENPAYILEPTSVALTAGTTVKPGNNLSGFSVILKQGAEIAVANGGDINLAGASIDIGGTLTAPGGDVSAVASLGDINMDVGSLIDTSGFAAKKRFAAATGLPRPYTVSDGGDVVLEALYGGVSMAEGAAINVSGSESVTNYYADSQGRTRSYNLAGSAGSVLLSGKTLDISGDLTARVFNENAVAGTLALNLSDPNTPFIINTQKLLTYVDPLKGNFDDIRLSGMVGLEFDAGVDIVASRAIELDAPYIKGADGETLSFTSHHVTLANTLEKYDPLISEQTVDAGRFLVDPESGTAGTTLDIDSDWTDITGYVALTGFADVALTAANDMTLTDESYVLDKSINREWKGGLAVFGDLTLAANRIYSHTDAEVTITTGREDTGGNWLGGTLRIDQAGGPAKDGTILSANGQITLVANEMDINGTLLAPMGRLELLGAGTDSRISLGTESLLSVQGSGAVVWGRYSGDLWRRPDKTNPDNIDGIDVTMAPETGITLIADVVDMAEGSVIDVSGGGMVYAAEFQPSISGSADPLSISDRYVIVPDGSVSLPGEAVYIPEGYGIPAGTYTLLPDAYAFLPNAYIIKDLGAVVDPGAVAGRTAAGYDLIAGYFSQTGTDSPTWQAHAFSVRKSADVLAEGLYTGDNQIGGDGGGLNIISSQAVLAGTLKGAALDETYKGGQLLLSAANVVLGSETLDRFMANNPDFLPDSFLYLQTGAIASGGFAVVEIGIDDARATFTDMLGEVFSANYALLSDSEESEQDTILYETEQVRIADNANLTVDALGIYATDRITIGNDAVVDAGELLLISPDGQLVFASGSEAHVDVLGVFAQSLDQNGTLDVDTALAVAGLGEMALLGQGVIVDPDPDVMTIDASTWVGFAGVDQVALAAGTGLSVYGDVDVVAEDLLYINAPRILGEAVDGKLTAQFSADRLLWTNTRGAVPTPGTGSSEGMLSFHADSDLEIGPGIMGIDGFAQTLLAAENDIRFTGIGELNVYGDLTLDSAVITASPQMSDDAYTAADYVVSAVDAALATSANGNAPTGNAYPGGALTLAANTISHGGIIDNFAGSVTLSAETGIVLDPGSEINAKGGILSYDLADSTVYQAYAAGGILLDIGAGPLVMAQGATLNVSNSAGGRPAAVDANTWEEWQAAGYLDAGDLAMDAGTSKADISGTLMGMSPNGRGGSFALTAADMDVTQLAVKLNLNETGTAGGFDHQVALQATSGNITVAEADLLSASLITLTADTGRIDVSGRLIAGGTDADRGIYLYGANDVVLHNQSLLDARGTGSDTDGGTVLVSSTNGWVDFQAGAVIRADGNGSGSGGLVRFRSMAYDSTSDGALDGLQTALAGTISGAARVEAEAVVQEVLGTETITTSLINAWKGRVGSFMDTYGGTLAAGMTQSLTLENMVPDGVVLVPGLDIVSYGDMVLGSAWELDDLSDWRYGSTGAITGRLYLRAVGDLTLNANLTDAPHSDMDLIYAFGQPASARLYDSWAVSLVAGADTDGADFLGATAGTGNMTITNGHSVYTESNDIHLVAGNDMTIGKGDAQNPVAYNIYSEYDGTVATHDGRIQVVTGGDLVFTGDLNGSEPAIQSHLGDIDVDVQGDIDLGHCAAIRTTGWTDLPAYEYLVQAIPLLANEYNGSDATYWEVYNDPTHPGHAAVATLLEGSYLVKQSLERRDGLSDGGSIQIRVGGDIAGTLIDNNLYTRYDPPAVTRPPSYFYDDPEWAGPVYNYSSGGGRGGGSASFPVSGIVAMAGGNITLAVQGALIDTQVAAFGVGDMDIRAGKDANGRYLIEDGRLTITTMENFGNLSPDRAIEIIDGYTGEGDPATTVSVTAQGNIDVGTVIDPFMALYWSQADGKDPGNVFAFEFTEDTALSLAAMQGTVTLSGETEFYDPEIMAYTALPANVSISAGKDIRFENQYAFWMMPAADGSLDITAGRDILGINTTPQGSRTYAHLLMSNLAPEQIYSNLTLPGMSHSQITFEDLNDISVYGDYDGFMTAYKETFLEWWDLQDVQTRAEYQDLYHRINNGTPLHTGDDAPVVISAGGDITNLALNFPKQTQITAGGNISDSYIRLQHTDDADISVLSAGDTLSFSPLPATYQFRSTNEGTYQSYLRLSGVELAGPGTLMAGAENSIDLGLSRGLRTVGTTYNKSLPSQGASIILSSGYDMASLLMDATYNWSTDPVTSFFDDLQAAGLQYLQLKYGQRAEGKNVIHTDIDWVRSLGSQYAELVEGYDTYSDVPGEARDQLADLFLADVITEDIISPVLVAANQDTVSVSAAEATSTDPAETMVQGIDFVQASEFGEINMTQSQVFTQEYGNISALAASDFNVGGNSLCRGKIQLRGQHHERRRDQHLYGR